MMEMQMMDAVVVVGAFDRQGTTDSGRLFGV